MRTLSTLSKYVLRFLLPWACAACRAALSSLDDQGFCGGCWLKIRRIDGWVCERCGLPLKDGGNLCFTCGQRPIRVIVRAAAEYNGPLRPAIHRFKYGNRIGLARSLGLLMSSAWSRWPGFSTADFLVPVPLHPRTLASRGYNQAELLAREVSMQTGVPLLTTALQRQRRTRPQFRLTRDERRDNLWGAFALDSRERGRVKGRSVVLIDDLCTTGSTLEACAQVLRRARVRHVVALVLGRDI